MSLVKTSLLNGIAVCIRMASALVLNKILAVYVGPSGYAVIGQFQNVVSILVNLAGGLLSTGVTKSTAQHFDDENKQHLIWKTAIQFAFRMSIFIGLFLLIFGEKLSEWVLHRTNMSNLYYWLALLLPAMTVNNLLLAIVNGKKEIGIFIIANITGSVTGLILIGSLAYYFGLFGALLAFTISPAVVLLSTTALLKKRAWFRPSFLWGNFDRSSARALSGFALMGLTSALVVPLSHMLIRNHLASHLDLAAAGFWQASWKISEIYLMLITSTLSVYYLPRLAEIRTAEELKIEILKIYSFVMPFAIIMASLLYFFRDFIVKILFTEDFYPVRELFGWQLLGDVIKIASWILGYILVGRAMVKHFIVTEVIFCLGFYFLTWLFVDYFGLIGVSIAHVVNYSFHLLIMAFLVKCEINGMKNHAVI